MPKLEMPNVNMTRVKEINGDAKSLTALIASIAKRNTRVREDVAVAAGGCVVHAILHGDVTFATKLISALGVGWRLNALQQWFLDFGPFVWVKEKDDKGKITYEGFKLNKDTLAEYRAQYEANPVAFGSKLMAEPFWVYKPEGEFKPYNFKVELQKVIARGTKLLKDEAHKGDERNNFTGLDKAIEFAATL